MTSGTCISTTRDPATKRIQNSLFCVVWSPAFKSFVQANQGASYLRLADSTDLFEKVSRILNASTCLVRKFNVDELKSALQSWL